MESETVEALLSASAERLLSQWEQASPEWWAQVWDVLSGLSPEELLVLAFLLLGCQLPTHRDRAHTSPLPRAVAPRSHRPGPETTH